MSIIKSNMTAPPPAAAAGGPVLSSIGEMNSLRFDGSSMLKRRNLSSAHFTKWSLSAWVKISDLSKTSTVFWGADNGYSDLTYDDGVDFYQNKLRIYTNSGNQSNTSSVAIFRDTSAWYHVFVAGGTVAITPSGVLDESASGRIYPYINGVPIVDGGIGGLSSASWNFQNGYTIIGGSAKSHNFCGYMADIHLIDGQALTPHYFGANVSGIWVPKEFDGTSSDSTYAVSTESSAYGNNGFHLDFAASNMDWANSKVLDASGNGNNWDIN